MTLFFWLLFLLLLSLLFSSISLSDIRMSEALHRLRMSAEREESITGSLMILAVLFFLFAAVVVPSGHDGHDPDIHGSRINGSKYEFV